MLRTIISIAIAVLLVSAAQAQSFAYAPAFGSKLESPVAMFPKGMEKAIFFSDPENKLYFVDFEAVGSSLKSLEIRGNNSVVYKEDVTSLPANTIYEIDLKRFEEGIYTIELQTIEGDSVIQEVEVKTGTSNKNK